MSEFVGFSKALHHQLPFQWLVDYLQKIFLHNQDILHVTVHQ
ncbi:hypothetical protein ABEP00_06940 [Heyndrickxia sporothermodurans]